MKHILRSLFIIVFVIISVLFFAHPVKTETNILRAIVAKENSNLLDLSGRYSSKINVLIEGEEPEEVNDTAELFNSKLDKKNIKSISVDGNKVLDLYKASRSGLLSDKTAALLKKNDYASVKKNCLEMIYNPIGFSVVPLEDDPFMLFTDYILSLGENVSSDSVINFNDNYYRILTFEFNKDIALSPSLLNKEVKQIIKVQKELTKGDVNVYLTGSPIHSYFASSRSIVEINVICILSAIFVIGLCLYYFQSVAVLIPIALSLLLGVISGFMLTSIIFPAVHILTFVFSTTLIGICTDYSLHFFVNKNEEKSCDDTIKEIFQSLTVSLLTTVSAFLILLFSNTELLKQIAVFTISGLITVYCFVVLFYPVICKYLPLNNKKFCIWDFSIKPQMKKTILIICGIIVLTGLIFIKYNDDIRSMYEPSKSLLKAEKLFSEVAQIDSKNSFLIVEGKDFQDMLEKEENITKILGDTKFQAVSKYIPSVKNQEENRILVQRLYEKEIPPYTSVLNASLQVPAKNYLYYNRTDFPFLESFMMGENKSLMILYDFDNPEIFKDIDGVSYYNVQKDISDIVKNCRKGCMKLLLPVFLLLFGILAVIYKPKNALKIILPPLMSCILIIGILGLFHISMNLFHVIALFLIIGFSLDYSIFRFNGSKCVNDAVFMSCITSVFSFTLLAMTGFKLISSLGFVLSVGILSSYIFSVLMISKE